MDVKRDDYIFLDVTWKSGFKHTVPCRGYNLKSQIDFNNSLFWIEKFTWRVVTQKEYEDKLWASPLVADTEKTTSTNTTRSRRKSGQSEKTDGKKHSATKQSATTATKNTKKKASSSTATRKQPSGSLVKENENGSRTRKAKAQQEAPSKTKSRGKASKDSEAVRSTKRRTSSSSKETRNELREPKVSNVRKSKKDVARDDDSGTKALPRNGNRKSKTQ